MPECGLSRCTVTLHVARLIEPTARHTCGGVRLTQIDYRPLQLPVRIWRLADGWSWPRGRLDLVVLCAAAVAALTYSTYLGKQCDWTLAGTFLACISFHVHRRVGFIHAHTRQNTAAATHRHITVSSAAS